MKLVFHILVFCVCFSSFSQQSKTNDSTLPLAVDLKYQNAENSFSKAISLNPDLNHQIISINQIGILHENSLGIDSKNIKLSKWQPYEMDLTKELNKIMHRFPGDGSNLILDARGYRH